MYVNVHNMRLCHLKCSINNQLPHTGTFSEALGLKYFSRHEYFSSYFITLL
jgi:hypothetical protein